MEKVKSDSKNVHSKRSLFFNIGLVTALVFCFIAFEFKVYIPEEGRLEIPMMEAPTIFSDNIKSTVQKPKPKPAITVKKNRIINITDTKVAIVEKEATKPDIDLGELGDIIGSDAPSAEIVEDPTVHIFVEKDPQFRGGMDDFYKYLADHLEYPRRERSIGIDGKVFLQFIIERDGSITDIQVMKGVSEGLDNEAIRVLKESPRWEPGSNRGQPVRVRMTIPIFFQLR